MAATTAKTIIFTVTNNLVYDQRMIRICSSLQNAGYRCVLVGRQFTNEIPLQKQVFEQKRLPVWFKKGFLFYAEYNIRLFFYLLFSETDAFCCIDIDTMLPSYFASAIKRKKRIYDAHEYFSQMKEVVTRKSVHRVWHGIEKRLIPKFKLGYTVSQSIAKEFKNLYEVDYETIRNVPLQQTQTIESAKKEKNIIYQGAVNEGRGFEGLIPAMKNVNAQLHVYGDGNFLQQAQELIKKHGVENKVFLKGKFLPEQLKQITSTAYIGVNLVENKGLSQYYSLPNKFFDYIQHGVPQVTMNYPEYAVINNQYNVALLINYIEPVVIAAALNELLQNESLYKNLQQNCVDAAKHFTWHLEEKKLISFYKKHLG
jgi:glycosyltransferase involved in cell wall biosynthesis